jgi:hypothetical protein
MTSMSTPFEEKILQQQARIRARRLRRQQMSASDGVRYDDPQGVMQHAGRYDGARALVILGGYSGQEWERVRDEVRPDVILGANGVNAMVRDMDFWICSENMNYTHNRAVQGDARAVEFMEMFHRESGARVKLVSHRSWNLLRDRDRCISIRRVGYEPDQVPSDFSYRLYGGGFMSGWVFRDRNVMRLPQRVGNAGGQLIHMAGILGCAEVHTIGFDLLFREDTHHHWYQYPVYKVDHFRNPGNFIRYKNVDTQFIWLENARFLKSMEACMKRDGLRWVDHSDGLLKIEGLECAE